MIDIILHHLVHRLPDSVVLLLEVLQLLLEVDVVHCSLGLLLVPHCCCCGGGRGGGGGGGGRLLAGLRGPLGG